MTAERPISVDICVCTFRRPYLAETLRSIANLKVRGVALRVIVADNDAVPSAQPLVELMGRRVPFPLLYLHAPMSNISVARNACLEAATGDYVAFVDDDETVTETWLTELVRTAVTSDADVILGPVEAQYDARPGWLAAGDFHSTAPVRVAGEIRTGYTCNVLIRRRAPIAGQRFDLALGRSGGEDTEYFYRLHDLGARFVEAPAAIVREPVPPSRATLRWLLRRRFRSGQTYGVHLRTRAGRPWSASAAAASAKILYCAGLTIATLASPVGWRRNLLRGALHVGTLAGLIGTRQAVLYGEVAASRHHPQPTATAVN